MKPFVGLPADDLPGCSYAASLDQEACTAPATVHIIGRAAGWGWVALNSCDEHRPIAVAGCVDLADVHPAAGCSGEHYAPMR
ncbi:hypothetical protein [Micromonospora sp. NPDC001898]|uniref:hypothetical protein n=1 Tax=Micromonospora sp. NPDC001898 TaxID=3364221 RepID=UPI0036B1B1D5